MLGKQNLFLRLFPPPRFLKMPAVGFEVNEEGIRFIELFQTASGLKVGKFDEMIFPPAENEEDFFEGKRLAGSAEEFCLKNKLNIVRAALPDNKVYIFNLETAYSVDKREIKSAIELRLEEFVPIPAKEAIFDFQIINEGGKDKNMSVSVSVLPRQIVHKHLEFFNSLGLKPVAFEVTAQAIANTVIKSGNKSGVVIISFGSQKTSFHIVHSGIVHFSSSIAVGGDSMTQAIMKSLSVGLVEAESIKKEKGVAKDKKNPDLFFSMLNSLSSMKDEVTKLVEFWKTHRERYTEENDQIEKVIVCGKEAGLAGLAEYLEASSGVPTELADVWTNVSSFSEYIPPIAKIDSFAYATVIGLALSQYNK